MKMSNQDQLKMHSPNLVDSNIEKIAALFPNCITETKDENGELKKAVDFDLLKQELSQVLVEGEQERYRLDWVGKKESILTANAPIAKTLRPCREESVNFDKTENLFIEGDNLEALKLLQENYLGKVKMIYIDPPYNTGNDFIYEDDFAESTNVFFERSNQVDEEGNRLIANTESNGRFHSDWLSMIYSRLKLARNLLKDDGVIFISIDEREVHNLKKACDEIFGSENFVEEVSWKNKYGAGAKTKGFITVHEYILCYSKTQIKSIETTLSDEDKKAYNKKDSKFEIRGGYFTQPLMTNSLADRANLQYSIEYNSEVIKPIKQWVWSKERLLKAIDNDEVVFNKKVDGTYSVRAKQYLIDENGKERKGKPLSLLNGPFTQEGTSDISRLFNTNIFDFPKPVSLLKYLCNFDINNIYENNGIYLDFFAGSSTLAHAVMQLNAEDSGKRKFIMVQLPEQTEEKSEAFKAGYKNIAEVSKERIRRAGKKIVEDNKDKEGIENLDIGFRVLKIDSTNMKDVYYTPDALKQADMLDLASNIKEDRTSEDLLFQVMLDWGLELSLPIERKTIAGKEVFFVAGNSLVACFEELTFDVVDEVAKDHPLRFVSAEKAIHLDHDKTNIKERFKQLSPDTEVKFL